MTAVRYAGAQRDGSSMTRSNRLYRWRLFATPTPGTVYVLGVDRHRRDHRAPASRRATTLIAAGRICRRPWRCVAGSVPPRAPVSLPASRRRPAVAIVPMRTRRIDARRAKTRSRDRSARRCRRCV